MKYHLALQDDFLILCEPVDLMDSLPDSVFGALLGMAVGMTEVKKLYHIAHQAPETMAHEGARRDWRAPRFSFALRTATGSPFAERWAFAIQESSERSRRFRVWIEQQRTGKEVQLMLREGGTVEGLHDVEALPAAIHGAGLGMLSGINYALKSLQKMEQDTGISESMPTFADHTLTDAQAEQLLERYVSRIREKRKALPDS